jgi:hypothetical protein
MAKRFVILGSLLAAIACRDGSSPTAPTGAMMLSQVVETEAFLFRSASGDSIQVDRQLAYHAWVQRELGITAARRITYNKYLSREHMGEVIGVSNTNAWAEARAYAIHTIWPYDNHECVHLYASALGMPVSLLTEGLAVAFQTNPIANDFVPRWSGTFVHDLARTFRTDGRLVPIDQILQSSQFRSHDLDVVYPEAGSFARFLIDAYGLATFKNLYGQVTSNDVAVIVAAKFASVYGKSVGQLEAEWWAVLDKR